MTKEPSPWMEGKLSELVFALWPDRIEVKVARGNKWYNTLVAFARAEGIKFSPKAFFEVRVDFRFTGFLQVGGVWKAVYRVEKDSTWCVLNDRGGWRRLLTATPYYYESLQVISGALPEVLEDIPPVEETTNAQGLPVWRFVCKSV